MGKPNIPQPKLPSFIAGQIREYRYFILNLAPSRETELAVVCGGWERCAPDYRIDRADLQFYGIEYVAKGKGLLTVDGVEHELIPGAVFAYKPFSAHAIRTHAEEPLVKYFIDFSGNEAGRIISRKVLGTQGIAYLHHVQPIHDLFEEMIETGSKGGHLASRICRLLLELLSLRIEELAHTPAEAHNRARQSFERCRDMLQKHFRTIQSVSELAEQTHLAPAYLSRLFDRFMGEGPHEMLSRLKMNEAASHLIGGRFTVKEVATQVGFSDPYHFSRAFKRHFGIAPRFFQDGHSRHSILKIAAIKKSTRRMV